MPCMVGRAHLTGVAMMKLTAAWMMSVCRCVADSVRCENGNLILSRLVACHYLPTVGNKS